MNYLELGFYEPTLATDFMDLPSPDDGRLLFRFFWLKPTVEASDGP